MFSRRSLLTCVLIALIFGLMLGAALYLPNALPVNSDFSALYYTDLALVRRTPIYDLEAVEEIALRATKNAQPGKFFLARFPYPPWYALATFYLGLLPAQAAAALWFELNLAMLFLSVWLLTDGWSGRLRLIAFPAALMFLPTLGTLAVGQYDFPILLGTALTIYAARRKHAAFSALGIALLTFKPHLGALTILAALFWLIVQKNDFGRRTLRLTVLSSISLFAAGFIADPNWIVNYPAMLLTYGSEGNVSACSECVSLPVYLSRALFDGSLARAAALAAILLLICLALFFIRRRTLAHSHETLFAATTLGALLVSPYLYNYDFTLLLIPFAILVRENNLPQRIFVAFCYALPTIAILAFGRSGGGALIVAALCVALVLLRDETERNSIDRIKIPTV